MIWTIIIIICAMGFFLILRYMLSPEKIKNIKQEQIIHYIKELQNNGQDGATLLIQHQQSERFIQFAKKIKKKKEFLIFGFPDVSWSGIYYDKLKAFFEEQKDLKTIEGNEPTPGVPRFFEIQNLYEPQKAFEIAQNALKILELGDPDTPFTIQFGGKVKSFAPELKSN